MQLLLFLPNLFCLDKGHKFGMCEGGNVRGSAGDDKCARSRCSWFHPREMKWMVVDCAAICIRRR